MANKKKITSLSPIQQHIAYVAQKENKHTVQFPISESDNFSIEVKPLISASEMESFVYSVSEALFSGDRYMPSLYNLVFTKAILAYYTNLDIAIPDEDIAILTFSTDVMCEIESKINMAQLNSLEIAISKSIEFKKEEIFNVQAARLEEAIRQIEVLINTNKQIAEQFDGIDMKEATDAAIRFSKFSDKDMADNILKVKFAENADGIINN